MVYTDCISQQKEKPHCISQSKKRNHVGIYEETHHNYELYVSSKSGRYVWKVAKPD